MITLVISWRQFYNLIKNRQGLEAHIRRDIITSILEMHNQSRKNYISQNKVIYPSLAAGLYNF